MKRGADNKSFTFDPKKKRKNVISFQDVSNSEPSIAGLKKQHDEVKLVTQRSDLGDWNFRNNMHLYALLKKGHTNWAEFMVQQRLDFYLMKSKHESEFNRILESYQEDNNDYGKPSVNKFMPFYNKLREDEKIDLTKEYEPMIQIASVDSEEQDSDE